MTHKEDLEQVRRQQILDAAETVFSEQGFNDARMDDIVEESGLSKGALYWYYKSKDAIIMALLDRVFIAQMKSTVVPLEGEGTAEEKLRFFVQAAVDEIRHFERFMTLGYEFVALATRRKEVREKIKGYYQRYTEILAQVIEQGLHSGEFHDVNPTSTALSIIALYEGLTLMWFLDPSAIDWDEMTEAPLNLILDGMRTKDT